MQFTSPSPIAQDLSKTLGMWICLRRCLRGYQHGPTQEDKCGILERVGLAQFDSFCLMNGNCLPSYSIPEAASSLARVDLLNEDITTCSEVDRKSYLMLPGKTCWQLLLVCNR